MYPHNCVGYKPKAEFMDQFWLKMDKEHNPEARLPLLFSNARSQII